MKTEEERFWEKVDRRGQDNCWEWTAAKRGNGYGMFGKTRRKTVRAHKYSYELHNGEIPEGFVVHHICNNPACVNPDHLKLMTESEHHSFHNSGGKNPMFGKTHSKETRKKISENHADFSGENNPMFGRTGENHPLAKLTEKDALKIRKLASTGNWTQTELANKFGVSQRTIGRIVNRKTWAHI